MYNMPHIHVAC